MLAQDISDVLSKPCAFRTGTIPNGCESTLMGALKCAMEHEPCYWHETFDKESNPKELCAGWCILVNPSSPKITARWDYSVGGDET